MSQETTGGTGAGRPVGLGIMPRGTDMDTRKHNAARRGIPFAFLLIACAFRERIRASANEPEDPDDDDLEDQPDEEELNGDYDDTDEEEGDWDDDLEEEIEEVDEESDLEEWDEDIDEGDDLDDDFGDEFGEDDLDLSGYELDEEED